MTNLQAPEFSAGLSPLEQIVATMPEEQQRRHEEFVQKPCRQVLLIEDLGSLGPLGRGGMRGVGAWAGAKLDLFAGRRYKVTHVARGSQARIETFGGVRRIDVADVKHYGWFRTRSNLVEIARQLFLLFREEARRTGRPLGDYCRWHDTYGTDGAFVGKMLEQHIRVEQDDRYLREHFGPILGARSVLTYDDLAAHFGGVLQRVYTRLGQTAIDRWQEETGGTPDERNAVDRFSEWVQVKLRWPALEGMLFFNAFGSGPLAGIDAFRVGMELFRAQIELGPKPAASFPTAGRTIFTPVDADRFPSAARDADGGAVKQRAWRVVQRMLLGGSDAVARDPRAPSAAKMFRGLGGSFPRMAPVRAVAVASDEVRAWTDLLGRHEEVSVIDYRYAGGYVPLVEEIVAKGVSAGRQKGDRPEQAPASRDPAELPHGEEETSYGA